MKKTSIHLLFILALAYLFAAPASGQTYLSHTSHKQGAENAISITATGAQTGIDVTGMSFIRFPVSGTYAGVNFKIEGSTDGSAYPITPLPMFRGSDGVRVTATGALTNAVDYYDVDCG